MAFKAIFITESNLTNKRKNGLLGLIPGISQLFIEHLFFYLRHSPVIFTEHLFRLCFSVCFHTMFDFVNHTVKTP